MTERGELETNWTVLDWQRAAHPVSRDLTAKIASLFSLWMYTMNRCNKPHFFLAASLCAVLTFSAAPVSIALAQGVENALARNFPPSSKRGDLIVTSTVEGKVNGDAYRLAPGLRLFNKQNQLVFAHSVVGQKLDVRYVIEPSTGMLHTAWVLTQAELAKEPKRGWFN